MISLARSSTGFLRQRLSPFACRFKSASAVSQQTDEQSHSEDHVKINTKIQHNRLEKRNPFMKNLFVAEVDTDLLVYPESLNRDEQSRVTSERQSVERALEKSDLKDYGECLKRVGAFGLQSPIIHGGKSLIETELAYFNEIISQDFPTAVIAEQHNAIVQLLNRFGSEKLKSDCQDQLSSGQKTATCALFEVDTPSQTMFSTVATLDQSGKGFLLKGSKSFVINGDKAAYYLVIASTKSVDQLNLNDTTITAFLVDANASGVHKVSEDETLGLNTVKHVTVRFDNVLVSNEQIIGSEGMGAKVLAELLKSTRVQSSVLGVQLTKRFLNQLVKHCIETKSGAGHIMDIENVAEQLSRSLAQVYAAESMIYLTTGLLDDFVEQDADMEAAITKIFTIENLLQMAIKPLHFVGPQALLKGNEFEPILRDALQFAGQDETLDSIKFYVALTGLQHAGTASFDIIKKDRNPAMNPSHVISRIFDKNTVDNPKKFVNLEHFMHPSLDEAANLIEFSIMRLKLSALNVLSRHGIDLVNRHIELIRVADMAVLIYAMLAAATRASRSYCIGLRHGEHEILIANAFCRESSETVKRLAQDLEKGQYLTNDDNYLTIARHLFAQKGYFCEHPLAKNF